MTKTFLCGSDLSDSGRRAADFAASLAKDLELGMCLVHAYAGMPHLDPRTDESVRRAAEGFAERLEAEHDALLAAMAVEKARLEAKGARVTSARLVEGSPQEVLVREAIGLSARLIAVGPHAGRGALLDRFFGSTADHVLRHAPCPVLVAPSVAGEEPGSIRGKVIVVGIDGEPASLAALSVALEIAAEASASVEAIYVGEDAGVVDRAVAYVRAHAAQAHLAAALAGVRRTAPEGKSPAVLLEAARRTHAALVVVGTAGRTGLPHVVLGSVAEEVCRNATMPILVVRANGANGRR